MSEKIKRVRFKIGNKVYPTVSIEELQKSVREIAIKNNILAAIYKKVEEVRWLDRDPNTVKVCAICEHYVSKMIYDIGSDGKCLANDDRPWTSFADTCKKWKWDGIRLNR